jgi:hypothetical protein
MRRRAQAATFVALAACAAFAYGCASSNSAMLSDDTALVYATAADPSQREQVLEATLKAAAELTNAHGYRYFVILSATDTTRTVTIPIAGHALPNETDHRRAFGATFGNAPERPGNTYVTPDTQLQRVRPGLDIVIRMYRTGEIAEMDGVWDAEAMLALRSSAGLRR